MMIKDHFKAVLQRVATWPDERQEQLAALALEIEAEMAGDPYHASADELKAIDEAMAGETADKQEIKKTYIKLTGYEGGIR